MNARRPQFVIRSAIAIALLLASPSSRVRNVARADDPFPDPAPAVKTFEWSLSPATEPSPALKYKLLHDLADCVPGNAAVYYNRAILLKEQLPKQTAEQRERQSEWNDLSLDKLHDSDLILLFDLLDGDERGTIFPLRRKARRARASAASSWRKKTARGSKRWSGGRIAASFPQNSSAVNSKPL